MSAHLRMAALLVAIAVTGAAGAFLAVTRGVVAIPGVDDEVFLSAGEYREEFAAEAANLTWPAGAGSPAAPHVFDDAGYERGAGRLDAQARWLCAWQIDYLNTRRSDPVAARRALTEAAGIRRLDIWDAYDDATRRLVLDRLARARGGDPVPIQDEVTVSCVG